MTLTAQIDRSRETEVLDRTSKARRQGELAGWAGKPRDAEPGDPDLVFPPLSPPPVWPRVFPSL